MTSKDKAKKIVNGERQESYGHPFESFTRIGKIWEGILGIPVSPNQVALCMTGLKLAREAYKHKEDNIVDARGYLDTLEMVIEKQKSSINLKFDERMANRNK